MTLMEELAIAVLRGDEVAADALADLWQEVRVEKMRERLPVTQFKVPAGNKKLIIMTDPRVAVAGRELVIDSQQILEESRRWLLGERDVMLLQNLTYHLFVEE